jgi:diacylglycerol kinase family enzyme
MRLRTMTLDLHVNDVTLERTVPGLWVALGRGAFRLPVDGHAPSGRSLEVLIPETTSRLGLLAAGVRLFWRMRRGRAPDVSSVEVIHAPAFTLKALHAIDLSRDGEVERESSPIEFRIHPRALRVLSLVHAGDERWVA